LIAAPDFNSKEDFILTTDYSGGALSAILSQVQKGKERLIAAGGRKTTTGERNYPSWKGELAAIVYGCRKYNHILSYKPFIIYTDSAALKQLNNLKPTGGILSRWYEELASLQFKVVHKKGSENSNADALSRSDHLPEPELEEEREQAEFIGAVETELTRAKILEAQALDETLKLVRKWISSGQVPSKYDLMGQSLEVHRYRQLVGALKVSEDGVLVLEAEGSIVGGKKQLVLVPDALKPVVFYYCHQHLSAGHYGLAATRARLIRNFFYPGAAVDLANRIKLCSQCIAKTTKEHDKKGEHKSLRHGFPLQSVAIDLVGPFEPGNHGYKYILTVEDQWSRYINCYPLRSKETKEVAKTFMERFVANFGCPVSVHSDNGTEFTSEIFKSLMDELKIQKTYTPSYNPRSNGKLERWHRDLNAFMRAASTREDPNWITYLPALTLAHNTKEHSATGVTPSLAFLGRELRLPVDLLVGLPHQDQRSVHEHVRNTLDKYKEVYKYVLKRGEAVIHRNSHQYEGKPNLWKPGDQCWYLSPRKIPGKSLKMTNQWIGPLEVVEWIAPVLVKVRNKRIPDKVWVVHTGRIRPYHGRVDGQAPKRADLEDEDDPEAEEITSAPGSGPVEINIPINVPVEVPVMADKERIPLEKDPLEEPLEVDEPAEVKDQVEPELNPEAQVRGKIRERSPEIEPNKSRIKRRHEDRRGQRRRRPWAADSSSEPSKKPSKFGKLVYSSASSESNPESNTGSSESELSSEEVSALKVLLKPGSDYPTQGSEGAAGYDVMAAQTVVVPARQIRAVDLNLACQLPKQYFMQLCSRSGLAKRGIIVIAGIIDSDYTGSIKALIYNTTEEEYKVQKGDRIAQALILKHHYGEFEEKELEPTGRGTGGFGSTGN
jgi:deoxyuridine 5'-triphosphate nucleotidohydrolase